MRGVAGEPALSLKSLMQAVEQLFDGERDGGKFGGAENSVGRNEVPGARGNAACDRGQFFQRREAAAKEPDEPDAGEAELHNAGDEIELNRLDGLMPEIVRGRGVKDGDGTAKTTGHFIAVDDAHAVEADGAIALAADAQIEVSLGVQRIQRSEIGRRCLRRIAEDTARRGHDFIEVTTRQDEFGGIEVDVVRGIFGIVDGAEEGIGASAEHYIEGTAPAMHLVQKG